MGERVFPMRNRLISAALSRKREPQVGFYIWINRPALQCSFVRRDRGVDARCVEQVISQKVIRLREVRVLSYSFLIVSDRFAGPANIVQGHSKAKVGRRITRLDR